MKDNHIVLTTIHEPTVILELYENISKFGHLDEVVFWIVGDKRTPQACAALCRRVSEMGMEIHFLDIDDQDKWGKKFPEFYSQIPFDNETRRNIGYLYALEHGCKRLISIDDDNFPTHDDFVGGHSMTGRPWSGALIEESTGFYNICEHLTVLPDRLIFPRGFPFALRGKRNEGKFISPAADTKIGVTAGLWIKQPDVDAVTLLNGSVTSERYNGPAALVLSQNTWSPINTQNTSVHRDLIPGFCCIPMGFDMPGGRIERYGDIWGGYFLQSIMKGTSYNVCFGYPVVEHRRNEHDHLSDLRHEYWGMMLTDWLVSLLRNDFRPTDTSVFDRVGHLSLFIRDIGEKKLPGWCPEEARTFIVRTARILDLWVKACKQILG